ncbi:unnamed protein product [Coregonus sp. 'balchen']|nr:unnamed protein product [Coregonus sp. 'balchen']
MVTSYQRGHLYCQSLSTALPRDSRGLFPPFVLTLDEVSPRDSRGLFPPFVLTPDEVSPQQSNIEKFDTMKNVYQASEKESISGLSIRKISESIIWNSESNAAMEMNPDGLLSLDYREEDPPPNKHLKYHTSLQNMIPFRFSNKSNPMDDAGFFSFTSFAWMTPMMWSLFRNRLDKSSLSLSSHDGADTNGKRFERLWEDEVAKVGKQNASLGRVFMRFQRTRLLVAFLISILFTLSVFIGPAVLVYEILNYAEAPGASTLVHGVGLCVALFISEFSKAFFSSLLWAVSLRTAIRVKSAFSTIAFQKIISLRSVANISVGEVLTLALIGVSVYLIFIPIQGGGLESTPDLGSDILTAGRSRVYTRPGIRYPDSREEFLESTPDLGSDILTAGRRSRVYTRPGIRYPDSREEKSRRFKTKREGADYGNRPIKLAGKVIIQGISCLLPVHKALGETYM